jgi:hypothetical protein
MSYLSTFEVLHVARDACSISGSARRGVINGPVVIEYDMSPHLSLQRISLYFRYDNGDFYEGGFRRGMRSGSGLFVSREGLQYKGEFSKNL